MSLYNYKNMKCPMTERAVLKEFHKRTSQCSDTWVTLSMIVQVKKNRDYIWGDEYNSYTEGRVHMEKEHKEVKCDLHNGTQQVGSEENNLLVYSHCCWKTERYPELVYTVSSQKKISWFLPNAIHSRVFPLDPPAVDFFNSQKESPRMMTQHQTAEVRVGICLIS